MIKVVVLEHETATIIDARHIKFGSLVENELIVGWKDGTQMNKRLSDRFYLFSIICALRSLLRFYHTCAPTHLRPQRFV